jgi:hypothetical protein
MTRRREFVNALEIIRQVVASCPTMDTSIRISEVAIVLRYDMATAAVSKSSEDIADLLFGQTKKRKDELIERSVVEIYNAYPRRRDRHAAHKAIRKALNDPAIPVPQASRAEWLRNAVETYATYVNKRGLEKDKIPYPATWFNRGSYLNSIESQVDNTNATQERTTKWLR